MANPRRAMTPRRATPQRATPRPLRRLLLVVVAAVVVVGGVAAFMLRPGGPGILPAAGQSPRASATAESPKQTSTPAADAALDRCIEESKSAAAVLAAADAGIQDWRDHVQAQTDGNSGKINVSQMNSIFQRTRLAGPADLAKYDSAVTEFQQLGGACDPMSSATGKVAKSLDACLDLRKIQDTAMASADDAMTDWRDHQTKEGGTDAGHYGESTRGWLHDWRNADKNLDAYDQDKKAVAKAPACTDV